MNQTGARNFILRVLSTGLGGALLICLLSSQLPAQATYTVTDVGQVNDLNDTVAGAAGINNQGLVVGQGSLPTGTDRAFVWLRGSISDLGTFGGPESGSHAINERGQVVGTADAADGSEHAFFWDKGNMLDLQTLGGLGGPTSEANYINAPGVVVGFAATSTPDSSFTTGPFESHAFFWTGGAMQDLGTLGGPNSIAIANNASGLVVGWSQVDSNLGIFGIPDLHAATWLNGTITPLNGLGGPITLAIGVNDEGDTVGQSFLAGGFPFHAVIWKNGKLSDLDPGPAVDLASLANGINNQCEVVGTSISNSFSPLAVVWRNGVMTDLNKLIPSGSGWYLMTATGVNDMGQIVGNGFLNGNLHAFLLTPSTGAGKAGFTSTPPSISISNATLQWAIWGKSGLLKRNLGR